MRERGLKLLLAALLRLLTVSRSREGAWIEIGVSNWYDPAPRVAPVRERGLKCNHAIPRLKNLSRSREGAWIEIRFCLTRAKLSLCRSREGAWIEIVKTIEEKMSLDKSLP